MPEQSAETDVLQLSELAVRLLRRLTASPGVIDTQGLLRTHARLTGWSRAQPLLHQVLTRYSSDDGSAPGNLALVKDQPPMLNLYTYLTNNSFSTATATTNNSYSATTNQFVSLATATPETALPFPPQAWLRDSSAASSHGSSQSQVSDVTKAGRPTATSEAPPTGTFRVSRSTGRQPRDSVAIDTRERALSSELQPTRPLTPAAPIGTAVEERGRLANSEKIGRALAEPVVSSAPTPNLPLVRTQFEPAVRQGESSDSEMISSPGGDEIKGKRQSAKDKTRESDQGPGPSQPLSAAANPPAEIAFPVLPLVQKQPDPARQQEPVANGASEGQLMTATVNELTASSLPSLPLVQKKADPARSEQPIAYNVLEEEPLTTPAGAAASAPLQDLPLVQEQVGSAQPQTRPPGLVWRKNTDILALRDLLTDVSGGNLPAAVRDALDALPAQPASSPIKTQSPAPPDEQRSGGEITTEGMLRRISRMLLIERERRGY
jgi:hypothetical protein